MSLVTHSSQIDLPGAGSGGLGTPVKKMGVVAETRCIQRLRLPTAATTATMYEPRRSRQSTFSFREPAGSIWLRPDREGGCCIQQLAIRSENTEQPSPKLKSSFFNIFSQLLKKSGP